MKKFRKISALIMALALICLFSTFAYAYDLNAESNQVWCNTVQFHTAFEGDITGAKAETIIDTHGSSYFHGSVSISYTYCDETMVRPTNYQTGTVSQAFTRYSNSKEVEYNPSSGYVLIEATGTTEMFQTVNGVTHYNSAPVSLDLY